MISDAHDDRPARERMETDFDTTFLVEAAAGTGKTTAIVARMVGLLRAGRARTSNIAAITFTRKAAGELRRRFQDELERTSRTETGDQERARLLAAIDAFDDITICTIHAFCADLLRERPVEAGVAPGFTMLYEDGARAMRSAAFRGYVDRLPLTHPHAVEMLDGIGIGLHEIESAYDTLCGWPDVEFDPGDPSPPDVSSAISRIGAFIDVLLPMFAGGTSDPDALQDAVRRATRLFQDKQSPLRDARILSLFIPKNVGKVRLKSWRDKYEAQVLKDELFPVLLHTVIAPAWREVQAYRYALLLPLLLEARDDYAKRKRAAGVMDKNDVLIRAHDMLRDHVTIQSSMAKRFTHMLVDEFEDTDPVQAEMLVYLCGDRTPQATWREMRLRPGALFAVGDPKQSIYRFRRADISMYNEVRRIVVDSGGEVLELSRSFRGAAAVCGAINKIFNSVFPEQPEPHQSRNVPLTAVRGDGGSLCGIVELPIGYSGTTKEAYVPEAATAVAGWMARAIAAGATVLDHVNGGDNQRPLTPSDVMILTRDNGDIPQLAAALDDAGLPFTVDDGIPCGDTDELRMLLVLLRVLADPEDETAMVSWLRSEWCGVDDEALLRWRSDSGSFKLTTRFKSGMDERIERGLLFIKNAMRMVRSAPPGAVVSAMTAAYGFLPATVTRERAAMRAGVFSSLVALIREYSTAGLPLIDIAAILEEQAGSIRAAAMLDPNNAGVRISTLHKAKGREAPVVIVFTPVPFSADRSATIVIDRQADPSQGWIQIGYGKRAIDAIAAPCGWDLIRRDETAFSEAEEQRVRYVAATRARNCLVLIPSKEGEGLFSRETLHRHGVAAAPEFPAITVQPITTVNEIPDPTIIEDGLERKRVTMAQPTFARYDAGALNTSASPPTWEIGRGPVFDTLVRRLMTYAITDPAGDLARRADALPLNNPIDRVTVDEALALVAAARSHELWRRILNAEKRMTEVPFAIEHHSEVGLPGILSGDIDLVFHDEQGWTIVDFITDVIGDNIEDAVLLYAPQLKRYRVAWEELTGQRAKGILWFLTPNLVAEIA